MPKVLLALSFLLPFVGGCFGEIITRTSEVSLIHGGSYGKAVFVVNPIVSDKDCAISVDTQDGSETVDCNTAYLVTCDIDIPTNKPFCQLAREIGVERDSTYPAERRK
tara:strand:+ start:163 stop:486 length:324 start_codon:yes stop_codon:yes gene_type:complete